MANGNRLSFFQIGIAALAGGLITAVVLIILNGPKSSNPGTNPGATNTPVVVRGGSMTFRTIDPNQWQLVSGTTYCTNTDISHIEIYDAKEESGPLTTTVFDSLSNNWKMEIHGHDPGNVSVDGTNGVVISPQNTGCHTPLGSTSIIIAGLTEKTDFYPTQEADLDGDQTFSKRYWDKTAPGCRGPTGDSSGDEDFCERMSNIILTIGTDTYKYHCTNGDCRIGIGVPQPLSGATLPVKIDRKPNL